MRAGLRWTLLGTLALSGVALLWQPEAQRPVRAVEREPGPDDVAPRSDHERQGSALALALPPVLPAYALEPAQRDVFGAALQPAAPLLATGVGKPMPAPPPPSPAPVVVPAPVIPPLKAQLLGTMVTPEGIRLVLLAREGEPFVASPGATTPEGWVVEAVGATQVRWVYPPLGAAMDVPIPQAPVQTALVPR
jgi:hypothetical protein